MAPLGFGLGVGVGGVLGFSGSRLWIACGGFSVAFWTPEVFGFEVEYP